METDHHSLAVSTTYL